MGNNEIIFMFMVLAVLVAISMTWRTIRSRNILQQWASQNGYQILNAKFVYFLRGPFLWKSSRKQTVYQLQVRDSNGRTRNGWLCCGSRVVGVWSNQTQVCWDDE